MKLPLQKEKGLRGYVKVPWTESLPFVENRRAVLIHRPRRVTTHQISEKDSPHIGMQCWCGTCFSGTTKFTFLDAPPDGKLLCLRCETEAVKAGLPSANQLVGHHVHLGRVVPEQVCCQQAHGG